MKNLSKYSFTNSNKQELESLRLFFDTLTSKVNPVLFSLINSEKELSEQEREYLENALHHFNDMVINSRFKNLFLRMVDLIELESKFNAQEFIKGLFENENYELLNQVKNIRLYREFM